MSNYQQRRRGNHLSPHWGKKKESHQRGRNNPCHHAGATGGDLDPGAFQKGRDQGQGRVSGNTKTLKQSKEFSKIKMVK